MHKWNDGKLVENGKWYMLNDNPMEKVYLKPTAQEINHPATEPGLFADSFIYESASDNTRPLGNLYLTGQVKSTGEDSSYALNLLASLAKREYYSETGTPGDDPRPPSTAPLKSLTTC